MFRTVMPVNLTGAVQRGGISHIADSVAITLTFDIDIDGLTSDDITITNGSGQAVKGMLIGSGKTWTLILNSVDAEGLVDISVSKHFENYYVETNIKTGVEVYKADTQQFDIIITKTVQTGGDIEKLFEFELMTADDPRAPQALPLTTDPANIDAFLVTLRDGSPLPPGRIRGTSGNVLLLKHGEAARLHDLPIGDYYVMEHANASFITAFNINSEGFFTAPDGKSRIFRLTTETTVDCFNSIVPEIPGEPERPFDPNNPAPPAEKAPQTGIHSNIVLPVMLLQIGAFSIVGAELYRNKIKKRCKK